MPYKTNRDLPPAVKDVLPTGAQDVYRNVANSVLAEGGSEQAAAQQAWGAVKNAGYEKDKASGEWRKVGKALSFGEAFAAHNLTKGETMTHTNAVTMNAQIHKTCEDKRLVYAWASVVTKGGEPVADLQGDIITVDELEKAAHGFMLNSREAGEMHIKTTGIGKVVESVVLSKQLQEALGVDLGQEGWLVVMKIEDDAVWERVKKGELSMLSIGGRGRRG